MNFAKKEIICKNGTAALFRSPCGADAAAMLSFLKDVAGETDFLLRSPSECMGMDAIETERSYLENTAASTDNLMILCEYRGEIAGNCHIQFHKKRKIAHRASIGIALRKQYWNLGIGTMLMTELIKAAKAYGGIRQIELDFIEGNSRARALYEKMGFRIVGLLPDAIRQPDGTFAAEYHMMLRMDV